MNELLDELEAVTDRLLLASGQFGSGELVLFDEGLKHRAVLVRSLTVALKANRPLTYADYNRLIIILFNGERIQSNLQKVRTSIAASLNSGSRDRMYIDRIAAQLPSVRAGV